MDGEARVLEDGIEVAPLERRGRQALEWIRGQDDEGEESDADCALNRESVSAQGARQRAAEQRDDAAEHRQNEDPEKHRAFVVPPYAGNLVDRRHGAVRILGDVENREVRGQVRVDQRREGDRDQRKLGQRGAGPDRHQAAVADPRAPERDNGLREGGAKRQHEGEMANLDDHGLATSSPSRQRPSFFSASTTSRGI